MSLTWHQLSQLGSRMATRMYQARVARTDELRAAKASRLDYIKWMDSINPNYDEDREDESTLESVVTLEGISVQEGI